VTGASITAEITARVKARLAELGTKPFAEIQALPETETEHLELSGERVSLTV
jgi:hypothetical protein